MKSQPQYIHPLEPIAAIATAIGESAIAIVRTSGEGCFERCDRVFRKAGDSNFTLASAPSHTAHYGFIVNEKGETIDEVMAIVYRSPKSFTTEDSVEINCHGGVVVTQAVLRALLDAGFRLAEPGEFTRRAFLAGRIDLLQAEAIGELIHAKTDAAYRAAISHLKGDLSKQLMLMRDNLLNACALLELELDFGEEDVEFQNRSQLKDSLIALQTVLEDLLASFQTGKRIAEGVSVAIVGRPNAGKSTLLNALLGKDRAIVSSIAGTTRDFIQESFTYEGALFQLIDTAGLRKTKDFVEQEGIRRSYEKIEEADLILYLYDASQPIPAEELEEAKQLRLKNPNVPFLHVPNKCDRPEAMHHILKNEDSAVCPISALNGEGIAALKAEMKRLTLDSQKRHEGSLLLTNLRHYEAVRNALQSVVNAHYLTDHNLETELIASDLRDALHHIGTITGKVATDEILNTIFAKFCIGK
ncbi:MAG: tRNA uridine-5-carboxymethylaminomethyl(34) synthesis GTPase MnmE [Chloroherpetonaceae bacterium]|nr:tRNA uridine-5-carboxymethylaminomethyl(34) synthesis GTPase MnmE [Chloroherpetonaceae bacterium]